MMNNTDFDPFAPAANETGGASSEGTSVEAPEPLGAPALPSQGQGCSPALRAVMGLLLLLPGLCLCIATQLLPAIGTVLMSLTDFRPVGGDAEFIGLENYERLFADHFLGPVLSYTFLIMVARVLIVALFPPLVALLVGLQDRLGRAANWVVMALFGALLSPVALSVLWMLFWGRFWGREPSPLGPLPDGLMLGSPDGARVLTVLLDAFITLLIGVLVGGAAYVAVLRGRRAGSAGWSRAFIGVWLLGLFLTACSALQSFVIPFMVTRGGPANATHSAMLFVYRNGFEAFRMGYGAAQATLLMLLFMILGTVVWGIVTAFRLRLSFMPEPSSARGPGCLLSLLSLPMLLGSGVVVAGLLVWGLLLAASNEGFARAGEVNLDWWLALLRSALPWFAIWLVQVPVMYLAGMALGFFRPLGRGFSSLLFLGFLVFAFIPVEALVLQWFMMMRDLALLDTPGVLVVPWLMGGLSLLVFKLFFDGAHEKFEAALRAGRARGDAFISTTLLPSLPVAILVAVVLSFVSLQDLLWPLVSVRSADNQTYSVALTRLVGQFSTETPAVSASAVNLMLVGLCFVPIFVVLAVLVWDRLALLAGPSEPLAAAAAAPEMPAVESVPPTPQAEVGAGLEDEAPPADEGGDVAF